MQVEGSIIKAYFDGSTFRRTGGNTYQPAKQHWDSLSKEKINTGWHSFFRMG